MRQPVGIQSSQQEIHEWLEQQRRRVHEIVCKRQELATTEAQQQEEWEQIKRRWEDQK